MGDFFGDALASISSVGDDINGFFSSSIGQAVARGIGGATSGKSKDKESWDSGMIKQGMYGDFNAGKASQAPTSKDYHETERQWLLRMKKFAGLADETAVKLGAK